MSGFDRPDERYIKHAATGAHVAGEGAHVVHALTHHGEHAHAGGLGSGIFGMLGGFTNLALGGYEMLNGHIADGAVEMGRGGAGLGYGVGALTHSDALMKGAGHAGVALDVIDAVRALHAGDYDKALEDGGAAITGAMNPALVPAWRVGQSTGRKISRYADAHAKEADLFGGKRGYSDWSADAGVTVNDFVDEYAPDFVGDIAGGATSITLGIGSGLYSAAHGAWNSIFGHEILPDVASGLLAGARAAESDRKRPIHGPLAAMQAFMQYTD